MLNIELDAVKKIEIGFVVVVLGIAGFLFFRSSQTTVDKTINTWVETRRIGIDPNRPISAVNKADEAKSPVITVFAFYDGKLEIVEYPKAPEMKPSVRFRPDNRREKYQLYSTPWDKVEGISDPYKQTLAYAAYAAAERRPLGLLRAAELNRDQAKVERDARQAMMDELTIIDENVRGGLFDVDAMDKVLAALEAYRNIDGDPTKDNAKAAAARKVVEIAMEYLEKIQSARSTAVEKYIAAVDTVLDKDQQAKLAEAGRQIADKRGNLRRPARG